MRRWIKTPTRSGVAAATAALILVACGDAVPGPTEPQAVVLTVISGDNQPGKAGRHLGEPFVVRVTNHRGEGLGGRLVTWTVTSGEGAFDDYFETVDGYYCGPLPAASVRTDAEGFARVSLMPTWFGPVSVTARATGAPGPVTFTTDASDPGALLEIIGQRHVEGKAGEWFDGYQVPHIFEVRVTDGQGDPVPYMAVTWAITSGDGWLDGCHQPDGNPAHRMTRTRPEDYRRGVASTYFGLTTFGTSTVVAAVPTGVLVSPVTYTVRVTALVINLGEEDWGDDTGFFGPDHSSDVTAPVGATVEWVNHFESARIVSTSVPPGGASFDSGVLARGERFQFVPSMAGTWEYADQVSGATGTLAAR
jgi:hypothetical protein